MKVPNFQRSLKCDPESTITVGETADYRAKKQPYLIRFILKSQDSHAVRSIVRSEARKSRTHKDFRSEVKSAPSKEKNERGKGEAGKADRKTVFEGKF